MNRFKSEVLTDEMIKDINTAALTVRKGGVILYPTDTVWGIGCDAGNVEAVERIYRIKKRAHSKALITLVSSIAMLERTVEGIPEVAYQLIDFSDKPLTIVYDRAIGVAPNMVSEDGSLAVRVVKHDDFTEALCRSCRCPLVSTSANVSGSPTPALFREITPEILSAVDYVCTTRRDECNPHKSSTIMRLHADGSFVIIRP